MFSIFILSQDFKVLGQWDNRINALAIACQVVVHHIDIEQVFPLTSDDGQRLNLRQVDLIERQDSQHMAQRTFFVRQEKTMLALLASVNGRNMSALLGFETTRKRV